MECGDAQNELKALQKKCKILEANRNVHLEDSQRTISQQQKMIDKLKRENKQLKDDVNLETKTRLAAPSMLQQQRVVELNDMIETYSNKIEVERRKVEEVEKNIVLCRAKALQTRKEVGGANAAETSLKEATKNLKLLENRSDQVQVSLNECVAQNRILRDKIDNLHRERSSLEQIYRRMEKSLAEQRKEMGDILEATNLAYEARDQAESEAASLKAQGDREQSLFDTEMKELASLIEEDQRFYDSAGRTTTRGELSALSHGGLGMKLLDRASINSWDTSADYNDAELESGFREAMEVAGVSDLDEFMALFDEREKRNFALFNTCNDNDEELNVLVEKIQKMRVECSAIEKDMQNGWGNEMVKTLHHKRDQIKARAATVKKAHQANEQVLQDIKNASQGVLRRLHDPTKVNELVQPGEGTIGLLQRLEDWASHITQNWESNE